MAVPFRAQTSIWIALWTQTPHAALLMDQQKWTRGEKRRIELG
jgi:hypothetical protein